MGKRDSLEQLTVRTVTGQLMKVSLGETNRRDWGSKKVTKECDYCPLCVSEEHVKGIAQVLEQKGRFTGGIVVGICTVKETSSSVTVHKFLEVEYFDDESTIKGCTVPKKMRWQSAEKKRRRGELY